MLKSASRYTLAVVLVGSAIGKLLSPFKFHAFVTSVRWMSFLTPTQLLYLAVVLEILLALLLLLPSFRQSSAILTFAILTAFTAVLMYASNSGIDASCGCFGDFLPSDSPDMSILRNLVLIVLSVIAVSDSKPAPDKE